MILTLEYKDSEEDLKVDVEDGKDDHSDDGDSDDDDDDDNYADDDADEREEEDFDDDEDKEEKEEDDDSRKSVWWFLDKSLQPHKAPVIDSLCMEIGRRCPTDVDVGKWVENTVDRDVYVMTFKLLWSTDPVSLPTSFYSCKSLAKLTLSHKILVDVTSPACLPSLKILVLDYVVYKDDESLVRFLSSCTVLEDLTIRRNKKDDNVTNCSVKVPSLLYFYYENYRRLPKDIDVGDTGRCLIMDTPALTDLTIHDTTGDSCSCSSEMPCLDSAYRAVLTQYLKRHESQAPSNIKL